jgi:transcriptional regulator with XRE-family HTH domain
MTATHFGPLLRRWRRVRRMTQQDLALDAEVSTRHLSCLETVKARPSREMVLVLASALAHGTAPDGWRRAVLEAPALLVPLELALGEVRLRLFSTITTLGTAQDATLADLRIETVLPADDGTDAALRMLLAGA